MKKKLIPKHQNSGKVLIVQGKPVKMVSNNYLSNFPNLLKMYSTPQYNYNEQQLIKSGDTEKAEQSRTKRGETALKNLYNLQNEFTTNDSVFYTPILQRIDGLIGKVYDPNSYDSKISDLAKQVKQNIAIHAIHSPAKEFNKKYAFIHKLLNQISDDEIINIINTDFNKLQSVDDFMKILPKNINAVEAFRAYNILKNMDDFGYKIAIRRALEELKKSQKAKGEYISSNSAKSR